ncbi:unnamed protein product, partial [Symbiodinium sp. CCMP2456]
MTERPPKKAPPCAVSRAKPGGTVPGAPISSAIAPKAAPPILTGASQGTIPVKSAPPDIAPAKPKAPPPGYSPGERSAASATVRPIDTRYGSGDDPQPRSIAHPKQTERHNAATARFHHDKPTDPHGRDLVLLKVHNIHGPWLDTPRPGTVYNPDLVLRPAYVGSTTPTIIVDVFTWGTEKDEWTTRISDKWTGEDLYRYHEQMLTYNVTTSSSRTSFMVIYIDMTWLEDYAWEAMSPSEKQAADDKRRENRLHVGSRPDILLEYTNHENFVENARYVINNIKDAIEAGIQQ